jgi:hypothetical protein
LKLENAKYNIGVHAQLVAKCSLSQNAFIKGRNLMDGVLSLHELMHYTHVKKQVGFIFKIDFEKAYGKVNWDFLLISLKLEAFLTISVCGLVKCCIMAQ